jgi:hypothetical protein
VVPHARPPLVLIARRKYGEAGMAPRPLRCDGVVVLSVEHFITKVL